MKPPKIVRTIDPRLAPALEMVAQAFLNDVRKRLAAEGTELSPEQWADLEDRCRAIVREEHSRETSKRVRRNIILKRMRAALGDLEPGPHGPN